MSDPDAAQRWTGRPRAAALVRAGVLAAPLAAAVGAGWLTGRLLAGVPGRLVAVLAVTTAALVVTDRVARRFLPLALLLQLSLLFPDRAPDRFRLALRAGSRRELVRAGRAETPAGEAARLVLALLAREARHDRGTRRHTERVRAYVDLLAEALRVPPADRERLRWAALVHDVGKTRVAVRILRKPARLDADEWQQVREHPAEGARLAEGLRPFLGPWFDAIGQHHERWDGTGYPRGLAGEQISYGARIVAVADAFEVMTARATYRRPVDAASARAELVRCGGTQFDPQVVRALLGVSLERLRRVLGPAAWLGVLPAVAPDPREAEAAVHAGSDLGLSPAPPDAALDEVVLTAVGLHPAAALSTGSSTHSAALPSGHDAAGSGKATGHAGSGGPGSGPGHDDR